MAVDAQIAVSCSSFFGCCLINQSIEQDLKAMDS